ncbi:MAG: Asp-tRNA(Asn)/Glu-tRNA(Gln) amidotransferase subunit GatC [Planctomycetaceae bacterium]
MPAPLSTDDVAKVAQLSRLKLSPAERERMTSQLARVLEYVSILNEVDTEGVELMAHAVEVTDVLRDDVVRESLPRKAALANAPQTDGEYFLVPAIL